MDVQKQHVRLPKALLLQNNSNKDFIGQKTDK